MKKFISILSILFIVCTFIPTTTFALDDEANDMDPATLEILQMTSSQGTAFTNRNLFTPNPALTGEVFDYSYSSTKKGVGYMNVIAFPHDQDAEVKVYTTILRNPSFVGGHVDGFTGRVTSLKEASYDGTNYPLYEFRTHSECKTCILRIEVTMNGYKNNYNVYCYGLGSENQLEEIKNGFVTTVDEQTDVSAFISSAKVLVETAKPLYKARMDAATDAMEACKIANEFNILVCQAKAVEDEYQDLKDAVDDAENALSELDSDAQANASAAITAAQGLDLAQYSEEDASAITDALTALQAKLESEEATTAEINAAVEALNSAVNTAKQNALQKAKETAESALNDANGENDSLNGQIGDLQAELEGVKTDLETAKTDLQKATDDLKNTKQELDKVNAEVAKVSKVKAVSAKAGKKKVTVKWKKASGATGYVIFRSLKKKSGYTEIKTIKKAKTVKFVDKKVKKGKKYFYKIRAYKNYNGNQLFGAYSKVLKTAKVK